ncbi:MAG: CRISPR-associated endoribonuclease Cas6 [Bacteroidota bacterium]
MSFVDTALGKRLLGGVLDAPDVTCGMRVTEVQLAESPEFGASHRFLVDGAVLTRRNRDDGGRDHLTFEDAAADTTLTRTLQRKLAAAGLDTESEQVRVRFDRAWSGAKSKVVTLKGVTYKTSVCPVVVEGTPEVVRFAWLVGAGELTGSGLGALR